MARLTPYIHNDYEKQCGVTNTTSEEMVRKIVNRVEKSRYELENERELNMNEPKTYHKIVKEKLNHMQALKE